MSHFNKLWLTFTRNSVRFNIFYTQANMTPAKRTMGYISQQKIMSIISRVPSSSSLYLYSYK